MSEVVPVTPRDEINITESVEVIQRTNRALGLMAAAVAELRIDEVVENGHQFSAEQKEEYLKFGRELISSMRSGYGMLEGITDVLHNQVEESRPGQVIELTAPSPKLPSVAKEVAESISEDDLHFRFVNPEVIPEVKQDSNQPVIVAEIVGRNSIKIGDQEIELSKNELYVFNALLMQRDRLVPPRDIKKFGFAPELRDPKQAFIRAMTGIKTKINEAANIELIGHSGEKAGRKYHISPQFLITDSREIQHQTYSSIPQEVKKNP